MGSLFSRQGPSIVLGGRPLRILGLLLAASWLAVAANPSTASAADVSVMPEGAGTTLSYVAAPGEANVVRIELSADTLSYVLTEDGAGIPVNDADGVGDCEVVGQQATCPATVTLIRFDLGDQSDNAVVTGSLGAQLFGGEGNDVLAGGTGNDLLEGGPESDQLLGGGGDDQFRARDDAADSISCGEGIDSVISDTSDTIDPGSVCETVDDGRPPGTTIESSPVATTNSSAVTFTFSADEPGATFECWLNDAAREPCTSPQSYGSDAAPLAEGSYTFSVAAKDGFGNAGGPATFAFTVDRTAPTTTIEAGPSGVTDDSTPTFQFSSNETNSSFKCIVDGGSLRDCSSPYTLGPLSAGDHALEVLAIDPAGNVEQTPATRRFTVQSGATAQGGPPSPVVVSLGSLVLISGNTVKLSKKGIVAVSLRCIGSRSCKGTLALTSANKVRVKAAARAKRAKKRILKLGGKKFSIASGKRAKVRVRLGRKKARAVRRLRRLKVRATIRQVSASGFPLTSTRTFLLRTR